MTAQPTGRCPSGRRVRQTRSAARRQATPRAGATTRSRPVARALCPACFEVITARPVLSRPVLSGRVHRPALNVPVKPRAKRLRTTLWVGHWPAGDGSMASPASRPAPQIPRTAPPAPCVWRRRGSQQQHEDHPATASQGVPRGALSLHPCGDHFAHLPMTARLDAHPLVMPGYGQRRGADPTAREGRSDA